MQAHDQAPTDPQETPHSIGQAAEAAGLTPQALRMWEERYGRPVAARLPSGHRRYSDADVRWLRRVADALARGHRAGAVVPLSEEALSALLEEGEPEPRLGKGPQVMLDWLVSYGADEIRAWLGARWDPENYLKFLEDEIAPLVSAVGRGWADGELDVRHEHFLSEILEDQLRGLRGGFRRSPGAPSVLLATLPGELHGIGLQMIALGAAAHGLAVQILGVNTPIDSILRAAGALRPAIVAISASTSSSGTSTYRMLGELRRQLPTSIRLVAGGGGMQGPRRRPRGVECLKDLAAWDAIISDLAQTAT